MDTLSLLSQSLRGAIVAPPGKLLFVADYASIEARVLLWCAQDHEGLQKFRDGVDLYVDMASAIYKQPVSKEKDPEKRQLGKIAILGLGYQMGAPKFHATCANQGIHITEELAQQTVDAYRAKYFRVKQLWYDQETAAGEATYDKEGTEYECYPCMWVKEGRFLYCRLPSGRRLAYPDPAIKTITTSWGARKNALTYMGVNATTRKWHRQNSYGGLLVENIVQAISRDIMGEAMLRCEESRIYSPILSVHDELIAEGNAHHGNVEEFVALVGQCPTWAPGCPVAAEGWAGTRYRK
jgi:DNA polymerase bacteriophage-type